jgi:hypothetical protein
MSNDKDRDEALEAQIEADWGYLIEHVGKSERDEALSNGMVADFSAEEISLIRFIERDRARVCAEVTQQERERLSRKMPTKQQLIAVMQSRGCDGIVSVKLAASDICKRLATILTPKSPSEPRTCEACGGNKKYRDFVTGEFITCPRCAGTGIEPPSGYCVECSSSRPTIAEDVATIRLALDKLENWTAHYTATVQQTKSAAIRALDRVAGKEV